ncbi:MAG: ribokinase [Alphaproteobacteria bacterium]|nr:ribokinase [Alphaproteobacteria bacterium]
MDVAVVGSLHLDIMVAAKHLPVRDETLVGSSWHTKCGGKGGNQAVAAARLGARVAFGGRIGADDFGERLKANLTDAGVDISCLAVDAVRPSGMSVAISESTGDYGAVIVSGANLAIPPDEIVGAWKNLWQAKVLLLQNEASETVNLAAATAARAKGAKITLNAAPAKALPPPLLDCIDLLIVNRLEASMLTGLSEPEAAIHALRRPGRAAILTMGANGLLLDDGSNAIQRVPAHPVTQISSHGAGDFFCGALAARLAAGATLDAACSYGAAAAALFVSRNDGARAAITHRDVEALLTT